MGAHPSYKGQVVGSIPTLGTPLWGSDSTGAALIRQRLRVQVPPEGLRPWCSGSIAGCDPVRGGFESHRPPHFMLALFLLPLLAIIAALVIAGVMLYATCLFLWAVCRTFFALLQ